MRLLRSERLVRDLFERVWNTGDVDAVDHLLAPHYTIQSDPGDPWEGQTLDVPGFKQRLTLSRAPFPDLRFDIEHLIADENAVAVGWRMRGTNTGPLGDRPATHRSIDVRGITIYHVEDGKLAGHTQAMDRMAVMQQLGMLG